VHWVAVPEAARARRVNSEATVLRLPRHSLPMGHMLAYSGYRSAAHVPPLAAADQQLERAKSSRYVI
jgi:hypothetical protein